MTVFRHFPTKSALAVDDPFDPRIVEAIAVQARDARPLDRLVAAMASAVAGLEDHHDALAARRARLVASTPALLGAVAENNARTQELMVRQLEDDGADALDAAVAAAAVLAGITAALLESAHDSTSTVKAAVGRALSVLGRTP